MVRRILVSLALIVVTSRGLPADDPPKKTAKQGLQAVHDLIGAWKGTGTPEGTREEKQKGFWVEAIRWEWQFKGDDAWLTMAIKDGKYFESAELRYLPDKDEYKLIAVNADKQTVTFQGTLKEKVLTLEREDEKTKEAQRLVISLLHANRYLYRYETKAKDKTLYTKLYQVGGTKEGVPFATTGTQPECVVSGGLGTIAFTYKDKTYYVCCSGCRAAFRDDPEKYIKEFEERKAKEEKEKKK